MMHDLDFYQSAETAWRYSGKVVTLTEQIRLAEICLGTLRTELHDLLARPPMYDLFNWSA